MAFRFDERYRYSRLNFEMDCKETARSSDLNSSLLLLNIVRKVELIKILYDIFSRILDFDVVTSKFEGATDFCIFDVYMYCGI